MSYEVDPRVDAYIDALPEWQQAICRRVRDLVHAADPEVVETIKRTKQPYFVLDGNICALLAARTHVNVFLYDGGIVPDPEGIITGGHDNKTARTVAIHDGEEVNAPALSAMFRQIVANNRAGGWRKLSGRAESLPPPADEPLPDRLGAPAERALAAAGYRTLHQLTAVSEAELLALHGVGPKAVSRLRAALAEKDLAFRTP